MSMNNAKVLMRTNGGTWADTKAQISHPSETEKNWQMPPEMGSGHFSLQNFSDNFSLTLSDICLNNALNAKVTGPEKIAYLVFSLQGNSLNSNEFFKKGFTIKRGANALYWSPDQVLTRQAAERERLKAVVISFPQQRLQALDIGSGLSRKEGACIQHHNSQAINLVLHQITHCRYSGGLRQLFMESKALELLALKWSQLQPVQASSLTAEQIRGVERVQALLLERINAPPSLGQLAKIAGMSHPILNRCFKQVTGYSVFGYLRQQRLELSRSLIIESSMTMTEIAFHTGFSSSGHFSRAFFSCYGMQPSRLREEKLKG